MTAKIFSPQRTQSAQRKVFVFFVRFVVQFWLRPKPRYDETNNKKLFVIVLPRIVLPLTGECAASVKICRQQKQAKKMPHFVNSALA